jgi:hypothetical protein
MPDDDRRIEDLLVAWASARDAASVRAAWTAMSPVSRAVSPNRILTAHSAALLAESMLGERPDWIVDLGGQTPAYVVDRIVDDGSYLDGAWDMGGRCNETWSLYERRDGARGVQLINISAGTVPGEGRPEGAGATVVRIFDRDRAASVVIDSNWIRGVATIGSVDLTPLELYRHVQSFELRSGTSDIETARGVIAQLASDLDAHYDTSTQWPTSGSVERAGSLVSTFAEGERSVEIIAQIYDHIRATVHGLPWGHQLELNIQTNATSGYLVLRLLATDIDRVLARLGAIATLR